MMPMMAHYLRRLCLACDGLLLVAMGALKNKYGDNNIQHVCPKNLFKWQMKQYDSNKPVADKNKT
jgi:hypothetical protein